MRKTFQSVYWLLLAAGLVTAFVLSAPFYGALVLAGSVLCTFAWPQHSVDGLQKLMISFCGLCLVAAVLTAFQPAWLPWVGVAVFGYIALTAKL